MDGPLREKSPPLYSNRNVDLLMHCTLNGNERQSWKGREKSANEAWKNAMDVIYPFTLPFQHLSRRLGRVKIWTDTLTFLISLWYSLNSWTSGCLRTCYQNEDILIRFGYIECISKGLTWRWGNSGRSAGRPSCLCIISQLILNTLMW